MKIAVTGGSGRVGRAIIELALAQGHSPVSIDRVPPPGGDQPNTDFIPADLSDYTGIVKALAGCEALVHMAAIPSPGRHPDHEVHNNNVVASYNVLRAAAEVGIKRVCQASSINAIGGAYSRQPRYDYFPLDELHPSYNEDPYSLSKWICEAQAESIVRRYENMTIASLRLHGVVPAEAVAVKRTEVTNAWAAKHLWGYTSFDASARAALLSLTAGFTGAEVFYIVSPETMMAIPSAELARQHFPHVPVRGALEGTQGFFDCGKAERLLGWKHNL
jgi:nucleoside-diphosphate-sugar epimerase